MSKLDRAIILAVASVAAFASYGHMIDLASQAGEPLWIARAFPLTVDGLVLAALRRGSTGWLALGLAVSVAANVAAQSPQLAADAGPVVSAWPPLALYGTHRLMSRRPDTPAPGPVPRPKPVPKPAPEPQSNGHAAPEDAVLLEAIGAEAERLGTAPSQRWVADELHVGRKRAALLLATHGDRQ